MSRQRGESRQVKPQEQDRVFPGEELSTIAWLVAGFGVVQEDLSTFHETQDRVSSQVCIAERNTGYHY